MGDSLAPLIDHTLLSVSGDGDAHDRLCDEARAHGFATVCVLSAWVARCAPRLAGAGVGVCTVVGFPLGAVETAAKVAETHAAVRDGATEIDAVIHVGALLDGRHEVVRRDLAEVVAAAEGRAVKAILETAALSDEQARAGAQIAESVGVAFVKTSTGFGPGGATVAHVRLLRDAVATHVGVKASGGIRDAETAWAMVRAGATRLGTSAGVAIVGGGGSDGRGY